jgi:hypothetical protein
MSGQTTHLDLEVLAEFRAGLIAGRRGAALAAHLAGCDRCAALDTELTEVSALLAAVPPPTLPADVANRLDMVLAGEVAERADYPERAVVPPSRARRTDGRFAGWFAGNRRFLRVLAPTAAVVLAGAGYGLSQIGGSPAAVSAAAPAVPSAFPAAGAQTAPNPHSLRAGTAVGRASFGVVPSDTNYLPGTLSKQVEAALAAAHESTPAAQAPPQGLTACVLHVTDGARLALVQSARYEGQPATVIVVSRPSGDTAWVVGSGCSATSEDLLDKATLPAGISTP